MYSISSHSSHKLDMLASTSSIRPLEDGPYYIFSRNQTDGKASFLNSSVDNGGIGSETPEFSNFRPVRMDSKNATIWHLEYQPDKGSYLIYKHGTDDVLDASQTANSNALCYKIHGAAWQCWAIRLQIDTSLPVNETSRVAGYTFTPLSQPQSVLTMESNCGGSEVLAQIRPAPLDGGRISKKQLWVLTKYSEPGLPAIVVHEDVQPWELKSEIEPAYCREVQLLTTQAKEQIAELIEEQRECVIKI
ncbi:hypothetical protein BDN70DRAFT_989364 [Pholiota conissans]|uniref:Uncharacterized protein n=1 Tax=Pholiota conissans TaxID=109636 RepID=A0A9P5ZAV3_9AGAR|nr:hypothetical protein BDN70DRAFT_989364 [Pholiota conissans]